MLFEIFVCCCWFVVGLVGVCWGECDVEVIVVVGYVYVF